jgi:hypothetical protein
VSGFGLKHPNMHDIAYDAINAQYIALNDFSVRGLVAM